MKVKYYYFFKGKIFNRALNIKSIHAEKLNRLFRAKKHYNQNLEKNPQQLYIEVCKILLIKTNELNKKFVLYLFSQNVDIDLMARKLPTLPIKKV